MVVRAHLNLFVYILLSLLIRKEKRKCPAIVCASNIIYGNYKLCWLVLSKLQNCYDNSDYRKCYCEKDMVICIILRQLNSILAN